MQQVSGKTLARPDGERLVECIVGRFTSLGILPEQDKL